MASNGIVKEHLRRIYNDLFGPGYFPPGVEAVYMWTWQADPENGPPAVWIDIMSKHGGDEAIKLPRGTGTWVN